MNKILLLVLMSVPVFYIKALNSVDDEFENKSIESNLKLVVSGGLGMGGASSYKSEANYNNHSIGVEIEMLIPKTPIGFGCGIGTIGGNNHFFNKKFWDTGEITRMVEINIHKKSDIHSPFISFQYNDKSKDEGNSNKKNVLNSRFTITLNFRGNGGQVGFGLSEPLDMKKDFKKEGCLIVNAGFCF